ncbi:MAG: hypothetical protein EOO60_04655 [Hymenobacter sp.]|nr:MAG: hypothetical protein EOO60_04655 [Hymenobacter sp.]
MKKLLAGIALSSLLIGTGSASPEPENPFTLAEKAARQNPTGSVNYLLPQLELRRLRSIYLTPATSGMYWQAMATYASFADETDSAAYYWQRFLGRSSVSAHPAAKAPNLPVAGPAILAQTRLRQVVMFNEEHTQPRGRWLVGSLLPALYQQGFRYLAIEALAPTDSAGLRRRGYPVVGSGFYTNEPHFGNLIRAAHRLGFRLVAYESEATDREQGQARNLLAATIARHPSARVLVLAGHGHISETGALGGLSMAQWVRKLSHIDPLTIDQTQAVTDGLPSWQQLPPGAYLATPKSIANRSITSDLYVFNHLRLTNAGNGFGQPHARFVSLRVPVDSLQTGRAHQLLVYWLAEKQAHLDAEPVLVCCLGAGKSASRAALLPGRYAVVVRDALGQRRWQHALQVL